MSETLPKAFIERMAGQLGDELQAFLQTYDQPFCRGLRLNPLKPVETAFLPEGIRDPVPWEPSGRYLRTESRAGSEILHEAGAWYLQEPSAMLPAAVLNPQPGELVLDLCAAPGGKSTQLAARMRGRGCLVCNEAVPRRAAILSRNLERMGVVNAVAVSALPAALAKKWPRAFHAVLVDAPCSGEGMFRRHPETRLEWSLEALKGCVRRQREILENAAELVAPGGRLVYSTCTLNPAENEENIACFLASHADFQIERFELPGISAPNGMITLYPHRVRGEGHFAALLRRSNLARASRNTTVALRSAHRDALRALEIFAPDMDLTKVRCFGAGLVLPPTDCPALDGVRVLRAGLHLGQARGQLFFPDHAWALASTERNFHGVALTKEEARSYQIGEELERKAEPGYVLLTWGGLALGWGKASNGRIKNHYPKGLRRQTD